MAVSVIVRVAMIVGVAMTVVVVHGFHAFGNGHGGRRLRVEHLTEQQHQARSAEGEQRDQPDEI
jgi:hypothetical protein